MTACPQAVDRCDPSIAKWAIWFHRTTVVVARLDDRAIQYSGELREESRGRGVLDHPLSRVMTASDSNQSDYRRQR